MTHPLVEALRDLDPYSHWWRDIRFRLFLQDPDAYNQWLDDEWPIDQVLESLHDLAPLSYEWQTARDDLAERDPDTYGRWLDDMQVLRESLRGIEEASDELNG